VQAVPRSSHVLLSALLPVLLLSRHEGSLCAAECTDHRARRIGSKHAALPLMRRKMAAAADRQISVSAMPSSGGRRRTSMKQRNDQMERLVL